MSHWTGQIDRHHIVPFAVRGQSLGFRFVSLNSVYMAFLIGLVEQRSGGVCMVLCVCVRVLYANDLDPKRHPDAPWELKTHSQRHSIAQNFNRSCMGTTLQYNRIDRSTLYRILCFVLPPHEILTR